MKSKVFKDKIRKELLKAHKWGLADGNYTPAKAEEFVEELFSHIPESKPGKSRRKRRRKGGFK